MTIYIISELTHYEDDHEQIVWPKGFANQSDAKRDVLNEANYDFHENQDDIGGPDIEAEWHKDGNEIFWWCEELGRLYKITQVEV